MTEHNLFNVENPRDKLIKGLTSESGSKMSFVDSRHEMTSGIKRNLIN